MTAIHVVGPNMSHMDNFKQDMGPKPIWMVNRDPKPGGFVLPCWLCWSLIQSPSQQNQLNGTIEHPQLQQDEFQGEPGPFAEFGHEVHPKQILEND